jgi:hypothetical protein
VSYGRYTIAFRYAATLNSKATNFACLAPFCRLIF